MLCSKVCSCHWILLVVIYTLLMSKLTSSRFSFLLVSGRFLGQTHSNQTKVFIVGKKKERKSISKDLNRTVELQSKQHVNVFLNQIFWYVYFVTYHRPSQYFPLWRATSGFHCTFKCFHAWQFNDLKARRSFWCVVRWNDRCCILNK